MDSTAGIYGLYDVDAGTIEERISNMDWPFDEMNRIPLRPYRVHLLEAMTPRERRACQHFGDKYFVQAMNEHLTQERRSEVITAATLAAYREAGLQE
jgi:hypothetical protein